MQRKNVYLISNATADGSSMFRYHSMPLFQSTMHIKGIKSDLPYLHRECPYLPALLLSCRHPSRPPCITYSFLDLSPSIPYTGRPSPRYTHE